MYMNNTTNIMISQGVPKRYTWIIGCTKKGYKGVQNGVPIEYNRYTWCTRSRFCIWNNTTNIKI